VWQVAGELAQAVCGAGRELVGRPCLQSADAGDTPRDMLAEWRARWHRAACEAGQWGGLGSAGGCIGRSGAAAQGRTWSGRHGLSGRGRATWVR
jgi:hypothetical protein